MSPAAEKVEMRRTRRVGGVWMLLFTIFLFIIYRYSQEGLSLLTGVPMDQISDMGPEILQRSLVAMFNTTLAIMFAALMAEFVEKQLKPDSFGNTSRWGVLFLAFFAGFCILAS